MKKLLSVIMIFFISLCIVVASDTTEDNSNQNQTEANPINIISDEIIKVDSVDKTELNEEDKKKITEQRSILELLLAYSIYSATDKELKAQAQAYGISSNYKNELLRIHGITVSENEANSMFSTRDAEKNSEGKSLYSFKVEHADRFEKYKTEFDDDDMSLYGNVKVSFSSGSDKKTLSSDAMILSIKDKILVAYGDISVSDSNGSALENIKSNLLVFSWENNNLVLYDTIGGMQKKTSNNLNITYHINADNVVFDNKTGETYFNNLLLSTREDRNKALWSISANDVVMKGTGDIFFTLMFLKIGRVPIIPLPAMFLPGSNLVFNPSIGFDSDKGAFLNTTTSIFGSFNESKIENNSSITSSFTSLFASDTNKGSLKKNGLFFEKDNTAVLSPLEQWASSSSSHLAILADAYTQEGLFLGVDTQLKSESIGKLTFLGGLAYKPQQDITYYSSSTLPSFRYGFDANVDLKYKSLSIALDAPFISDPQFKYAYFNRVTKFQFDSLFTAFGGKQKLPSTYSSSDIREYQPKINLKIYNPTFIKTQMLSSFSLNLDASISRVWKAPYSGLNTEPYTFKTGETILPEFSFNFGGTIFNFSKNSSDKRSKELNYAKAIEIKRNLSNLSPSEKLEAELLLQRALNKIYSTDEEGFIKIEEVGEEFKTKKLETTSLPKNFNSATADIKEDPSILEIFNNTYLKMTYSLSNSFKNSYLEPKNEGVMLGDQTIYNKMNGTITLDGGVGSNILKFSQTLSPEYIYSKQTNMDNAEYHQIILTGVSSVSIPIVGVSWNLGMTYFKHRRSWSDIQSQIIERSGGTWDKNSISAHNVNFSKYLFSNILGLSLSATLPPLDAALKPGISLNYNGASMTASHEMQSETGWRNLDNYKTVGTLSYSNGFLRNFSVNVTYDYKRSQYGSSVLVPIIITQSSSLSFLSSFLNFSQNISFEGHTNSGAFNYFSAINFSFSTGKYFTFNFGLSGEAQNLKVSLTKLSLTTGDILFNFWKGRIRLGFNIGANFDLNFNDAFQNSMDYYFKLIFEIKEFLSIDLALSGRNKNFYKYCGGGTGVGAFSFEAMFNDLLKSINIFNPSDLRSTNFVMDNISLKISHDMGDWTLSFNLTTEMKLVGNEYTFSPKYTFLLQWTAIPELKVEREGFN